MPRWMLLLALLKAVWLLFALALGACVGSLINVLAYRMPLGISVVSPPSRCPSCGTRLTWRENIPVLGWVLLRGRCRFCKSPISPEYPIVEGAVALLFGLLFAVCFLLPQQAEWLGVQWGALRPEWTLNDARQIWPLFLIVLTIFGSLAAMTVVDAKTFTIPLQLAWFPTIVAVVAHPAWAAWIQWKYTALRHVAKGWEWSIPTPGLTGWGALGIGLGGALGVGVALLLVRFGLIRRSFEDYEEWERATFGDPQPTVLPSHTSDLADAPDPPPGDTEPPARGAVTPTTIIVFLCFIICPLAGLLIAPAFARPRGYGLLVGAVLAPLVGGIVSLPFRKRPALTNQAAPPAKESPAHLWTQYPHARREMVREMAFLAPIVLLAMVGWVVAVRLAGPWSVHPATGDLVPSVAMPLWLSVLAGVLTGYLVGAGVVWAVRILGSLAFSKEAMGLGDVHLMGAVGACLGWVDATFAFFLAAFVGVFWAILGRLFSGALARAMPYGPFLAFATLIVFLGKPLVEAALTAIFKTPTPISLP